eukprot:10788897-Alexandrium_andersonii.AAC.1
MEPGPGDPVYATWEDGDTHMVPQLARSDVAQLDLGKPRPAKSITTKQQTKAQNGNKAKTKAKEGPKKKKKPDTVHRTLFA